MTVRLNEKVPAFRRKIMVTCDGAGASHDLVKELDRLASRHGYQVTYSVGWPLGAREQAAIGKVPEPAREAAIDGKGQVRERRSGDACPDPRCAHPACWIEEAHVAELTGLLRQGPEGDQLKAWPKAMRVFARRERHFPSRDYKVSQAWLDAAMTGCILLARLKLIALDGDLARAEPKTLRYRLLHAASRLVRGGRRRTLKIAANWPWTEEIAAARQRVRAIPHPL